MLQYFLEKIYKITDSLNRKINVRRSVSKAGGQVQFTSPKNGESRAVPVPPFLLKQLAAHLAALGVSDDLNAQVFRSSRGETYRHSNFYKRVFAPAIKASGMDGFRLQRSGACRGLTMFSRTA